MIAADHLLPALEETHEDTDFLNLQVANTLNEKDKRKVERQAGAQIIREKLYAYLKIDRQGWPTQEQPPP